MTQQHPQTPINPQLADMFDTAIAQAKKKPPSSEPPQIVVNGSHNVLSWGGTVYLRDDGMSPSQQG